MKRLKAIAMAFVLLGAAELSAQVSIAAWNEKAVEILNDIELINTRIVDDAARMERLAELENDFEQLNEDYGIVDASSFEEFPDEASQHASENYQIISLMLEMQKNR